MPAGQNKAKLGEENEAWGYVRQKNPQRNAAGWGTRGSAAHGLPCVFRQRAMCVSQSRVNRHREERNTPRYMGQRVQEMNLICATGEEKWKILF